MARHFLLAFSVLALSACSTLDLERPVAKEDLVRVRKVGVVSLLGDTFEGISIGTVVFSNRFYSAAVPEWGIEASAAASAKELLSQNSRLQVSEVGRADKSTSELRTNEARLVWELAEQQGFDTLIVLWPSAASYWPFLKPGFGFYQRSTLIKSFRCLYVAYKVEVYDIKTRKRVAWQWGGAPCRQGGDDDFPFKDRFDDFTETERQEMKRRIEARFPQTLNYAFKELELLPRDDDSR